MFNWHRYRARWRSLAILATTAAAILTVLETPASARRYADIAVDVNTGRVLHADDSNAERYPASLTKMMTIYLVFEQLELGKLRLSTPIEMTREAASVSPSKLGLKPGQTITVENAIKALVTKSANDVAAALAQHIAGTEEAFARMMTAKARELGMSHTTFRNANGLPDREQVTSARDMAQLAIRLYDHFPRRIGVFSLRSFTYRGRTYRNHNTLLGRIPGLEGMKTGYTRWSGFNLVASERRNGKHVIVVVFGGRSSSERNARVRVLLSRSMSTASTAHTRTPDVPSFRRRLRPQAVAQRRPAPPSAPPRLVEPIRPVGNDFQRVRYASRVGGQQSVATLLERYAATEDAADEGPAANPAYPSQPYPNPSYTNPSTPAIHVTQVRTVSVVPFAAGPQQEQTTAYAPPQQFAAPRSGLVVGRQPSTLQAQANRMSQRSALIPSSYVPAPRQSGSNQQRQGDIEVQIGAYGSQDEARHQLERARQGLPGLLGHAETIVPEVVVRGRRYYRARFTGFDSLTASNVCNALRRNRYDCLVAKAR
ncbi:MAG: serine hydrolase [Hyphomicrobiaceae bacterium]